jgi:hypothetical protein
VSVVTVVEVVYKVSLTFTGTLSTAIFVAKTYGIAGFWIVIFGSKDVMRSEFEVLASDSDQVATDFKKATQDESNMIAVAVSFHRNFPTISCYISMYALDVEADGKW